MSCKAITGVLTPAFGVNGCPAGSGAIGPKTTRRTVQLRVHDIADAAAPLWHDPTVGLVVGWDHEPTATND